jgi:hypothetical protein
MPERTEQRRLEALGEREWKVFLYDAMQSRRSGIPDTEMISAGRARINYLFR